MVKRSTKRKAKPMYPVPQLGNRKTVLSSKEVDNPFYSRAHDANRTNPERIGAVINVRESAIVMLEAKGVLDKAQVKAAERFRKLWERMGGAGAGAMDYSRVVVDGGISPDPISASQMEAGQALKDAEDALRKQYGAYAYKLVGYICGEGYSIHDLTETRRQRDTMTDMLRMYLDLLADLWQLSTKKRVMHPESARKAG